LKSNKKVPKKFERQIILNELSQYDPQGYDSEEEEKHSNQLQRIEIEAIEYDWIFAGKDSQNFLKRLAATDNDNLFTINTIRVIILFFWTHYFRRIRNILLIPYIIYMTVFCLYVTYIYEN